MMVFGEIGRGEGTLITGYLDVWGMFLAMEKVIISYKKND